MTRATDDTKGARYPTPPTWCSSMALVTKELSLRSACYLKQFVNGPAYALPFDTILPAPKQQIALDQKIYKDWAQVGFGVVLGGGVFSAREWVETVGAGSESETQICPTRAPRESRSWAAGPREGGQRGI